MPRAHARAHSDARTRSCVCVPRTRAQAYEHIASEYARIRAHLGTVLRGCFSTLHAPGAGPESEAQGSEAQGLFGFTTPFHNENTSSIKAPRTESRQDLMERSSGVPTTTWSQKMRVTDASPAVIEIGEDRSARLRLRVIETILLHGNCLVNKRRSGLASKSRRDSIL